MQKQLMNTTFRKNIIAFTFLLGACGLTTMSSKVCGRYYYYDYDGDHASGLNVTGYAERMVRSDYAVLELALSVSGDDCQELLEKLHRQVKELKTFWIKMGIKSDMIDVDNRPDIKISDAKQNKYSVQYTIVLTMDDLDMASDVQHKTNHLAKKGFVFSAQSLKFFYSKGFELQKELTKEAVKDGEKTATENAHALGLSIEKAPNNIEGSKLICASTYENPLPFPFERIVEGCCSWGGGNADIENKFSVLVNMRYAFKKDGESSTQSEKVKESPEDDGAETDAQG